MSNHPKKKIETTIGSRLSSSEVLARVLRLYREAEDLAKKEAFYEILELFAYGRKDENWYKEVFKK